MQRSIGITYRGNQRTAPHFLADFLEEEMLEHFPARLDPAGFTGKYGVAVTLTADAAQSATTLVVTALVVPQPGTSPLQSVGAVLVPSGSLLDFGGAKLAVLTADAKQGDTSLTVRALPTAIVTGDSATWNRSGDYLVPAGTPVGWTYAVRNAANAVLSPYVPGTHDEMFLTANPVIDVVHDSNVELLRRNYGVSIKENYLPDWTAMSADVGVADPAAAPVLGHAGSDGSAGAGAYDVGYTFSTAYGETKLSPVASVTKLTTEHISVADIAFLANATAINFYVSVQPGSHVLGWAKSLAAHAGTNILVDGSGGPPPLSNTTKGTSGKTLDAIRAAYRTLRGEGL